MNKIKTINHSYKSFVFMVICIILILNACVKDLNVAPINPQLKTSNIVYTNVTDYMKGLAKLYASYALSGQQGPAGDGTGDLSSIPGSDEGNSGFYRVFWMIQEACTDEAIVGWGDPGLPQLRNITFTAQDAFSNYGYYRVMFTVGICNQFLRDASDQELDKKRFNELEKQQVIQFRQEARFLRALAYYYGLDVYRNMPFVTEKNEVGGNIPSQYTGEQLYNYLVSELKDLVDNNLLPAAAPNMYGRATTTAAAALLARLYLNAEVYIHPTGTITPSYTFDTKKMDSVVLYCNKIIQDPYLQLNTQSLNGFSPYAQLFMGDNGQNANAQKELIFAFQFDHANTKSYNGTNFIINASLGGGFESTYLESVMGTKQGGWGGIRVRPTFLARMFNITNNNVTDGISSEVSSSSDDRGRFYMKKGGTYAINNPIIYGEGLSSVKFKNRYATEATPITIAPDQYYDTDLPVFRIGDIYLMRAEATLRGGVGSPNSADGDVNTIRNRAGAASLTGVTLQDMIDERGREMYHEGCRRSDLIRFGIFTKGYNWEFKGGDNQPAGIDVDDHFQIFPIPAKDLSANPNLKQNPGY